MIKTIKMREVIYNELMRLSNLHKGFPSHNWRWNREFNGVKLQDIPFGDWETMNEYDDDELLQLYSLIHRQYCKQG